VEQQQGTNERPVSVPAAGTDRVLDDGASYVTTGRPLARSYGAGIGVGENEMPVRNRVQWGPILAGTLSALGSLLLLTILGLAIGASAVEPGADVTEWGTGAGIWGGISVLAALFIGGWVAAKTAAVGGPFAGIMNGLMAALATVVGLLVAASLGLDNALGFLGGNLSNLANFTNEATAGGEVTSSGAFDDIERGAWGTLLALVLGFGAAAFGGYLGHNKRRDLIEGTG
jgi:hypothetical protein